MRNFAIGLVVGIVGGLSVSLLLVLPERGQAPVPTPAAGTPAARVPPPPVETPEAKTTVPSSKIADVRRLMREYADRPWHNGSPMELREALRALSAGEGGIPLDLFADLLRHPTFGFRLAALSHWPSVVPDARPMMRRLLHSEEDAGFRVSILDHLARQESVRRSLLMEALESPEEGFRAYAVGKLVKPGHDDDDLRRRLLAMLDDPSCEVRRVVLVHLHELGPEAGEAAVRRLISGDYPHDLADELAAAAVWAGRTLDVLRVRSDAVTARLLLSAICQGVNFEEEKDLIAPLAGDLDRWFGRLPRGPGVAADLATLAAALDEKVFLRKLLADPALALEARDAALVETLGFPSTRSMAILMAEQWALDVEVPAAVRCMTMWRICDVIDEERDPEYERWWKSVRKLAKDEESFWVRETAKNYLPD